MATLDDAVDAALPVVRSLESGLADVEERLEEAAQAIEEADQRVEEAWAPFESAAAALLEALPAHAAGLRERAAAARQALSDLPLVDASGGGGVELGVSVAHSLAPAGGSLERFRLWLEAAIPPLRDTEVLFRERSAAAVAERLAGVDAGMDGVRAAVSESVSESNHAAMRELGDGLAGRIDVLRARIAGELVPSFQDDEADWQARLAEAEQATAEGGFAAARQTMAALLQDGHAARAQAAHDAMDGLADAAATAVEELRVLSETVEAQALDRVGRGEDVRTQSVRAAAALRTAAGHLASAQAYLAGLGFGDAC